MDAFVEVAVGLPVPGTFHYTVPPAMGAAACVGARVLVPFGGRGVTGVIVRQADAAPADVSGIRPLREILDDAPALDPALIELCLWVADYYEAPPGEVLRAALPAGTAVSSKGSVALSGKGRAALAGEAVGALSGRVRKLLATLDAGRRVAPADLAPLLEAGFAEVADQRKGARVKTRRVATVALVRTPSDEERAALARAPRRREILDALALAGGSLDLTTLGKQVKGASAALGPLVEAGLVSRGERELTRDPWQTAMPVAADMPPTPSADQARALDELHRAVTQGGFRPYLLHGVTGSGKTEVYLRAIAEVLEQGRGAIVLVPEIALTPQLAARFRARFGDGVAVLHSGLSDGERLDQWQRLRRGEARIALGARSAVFAPVARVGMIVVDEEHDGSFKQEEGVRYHARDVALVRARNVGAVCVLGSATPSLETYANALEGRFGLLELTSRPTARPLPDVQIIDLKVHRPDGESLLTAPLRAAVEETLAAGEQAILFLNRRGFATFVVCTGCGHAFRCPQCSVSLTYHQAGERLCCHYCGHAEHLPSECPSCRAKGSIRRLGLGTERIEQALAERYPRARIARLDRDTAAGAGLRDVLGRVAAREVDILVGTQMVTKGHDFPGVTLVGVLCADTGLSLPDFRAAERTFQLLAQVAGRAGRGDRPGRVLLQTYRPDHPALTCAQTHDYHGFYAAEIKAREELGYPPDGRLVAIRLDGHHEGEVRALAETLAARARSLLAASGPDSLTILGPSEAPLKRLKGRSRWHMWVKSRDRALLRVFVRRLTGNLERVRGGVRVTVDVDPMSSM